MFNKKRENARMMCVCGGGSLKASLTRVFSLAKNEQAMTQKDNCGECDLGFNPHQEHYRQVNLPSVLSSPDGEGNGINSITNLSPYRPIALTPLAKAAFTMAEILLSLTIIGVVAAITLPSLTGNINERTWNTQRKALYSRLSQAIALMPQVSGYGNIVEIGEDAYSAENAAEVFLTSGLSKVLKLNNICDAEHLADCGLPDQIIPLGGGDKLTVTSGMESIAQYYSMFAQPVGNIGIIYYIESKAAAFETANGESVLVYYNPLCRTRELVYRDNASVAGGMCVNFIYDLNGKKGPNTLGKDVGFMSVFYRNDPVLVSPYPLSRNLLNVASLANANRSCTAADQDSRIPNLEEMMSMAINMKLMDKDFANGTYWTGTRDGATDAFAVDFSVGNNSAVSYPITTNLKVRCIKR